MLIQDKVSWDADIDKRPKRRDVGHRPFEQHSRLQVLDIIDTFRKCRSAEFRPRVPCGLFQLRQNVFDRRQPEPLIHKPPRVQPLQHRIAHQ